MTLSPTISYLLYTSHLTSQWTQKTWEFAIVLLLTSFAPSDRALLLASSYGLWVNLSGLLFLGAVGDWIDRSARLSCFRKVLFLQNANVLGCSAVCYALLMSKGTEPMLSSAPFYESHSVRAMIVSVHLFGGFAALASRGSSIAIEKDWIVSMSKTESDSSGWLSKTNVRLKQIDLSCQLLAPVFASLIIDNFGLKASCLAVGAANFLTVVVEYICTKRIHDLVPELSVKAGVDAAPPTADFQPMGSSSQDAKKDVELAVFEKRQGGGVDPGDSDKQSLVVSASGGGKAATATPCCSPSRIWSDIVRPSKVYFSQSVCLAGVALALLYANVLCYGSIMTAYVVWRKMNLTILAVTRAVSASIGLLGTIAFSYSHPRIGLNHTGLWSILMQLSFLALTFYSQWVPNNEISLVLLITGVCASRIGLWAFDIAVSQMMQERVPEGERGAVGGVQTALQSFFEMSSYAVGILWSNPYEFGSLISFSYAGVIIAAICYFFYWRKGDTSPEEKKRPDAAKV